MMRIYSLILVSLTSTIFNGLAHVSAERITVSLDFGWRVSTAPQLSTCSVCSVSGFWFLVSGFWFLVYPMGECVSLFVSVDQFVADALFKQRKLSSYHAQFPLHINGTMGNSAFNSEAGKASEEDCEREACAAGAQAWT